MKRILLTLLISIVVLMQQSYADDGSRRQVFELMFTMDNQTAPEVQDITLATIKGQDVTTFTNDDKHYLLWNNNQNDNVYQVTLHLKDSSSYIFYLSPYYESYYSRTYQDGCWQNLFPWMLGIWNFAQQSINTFDPKYSNTCTHAYTAYTGHYYINNSELKHITLNIYEQAEPITHGNWKDNLKFKSSYDDFSACGGKNPDDYTPECMTNDNKKYQMYLVTVNIANLFMGSAKEYLLGFAHNNGVISWQQKSEQDYDKDGSSTNKLYFQASYNQQPFCKVYMSDDLSRITSVEQTQYAPISCSYQSDYYEPKFIFACSGGSNLGMAADNQSACGWINSDHIQSQAFSSHINQL